MCPRCARPTQVGRRSILASGDGTDPTNWHLGYYYNLTGHEFDPRTIFVPGERRQQRDDWPFIGSVVSANIPQCGVLLNAISYPWIPERTSNTHYNYFQCLKKMLLLEFDRGFSALLEDRL